MAGLLPLVAVVSLLWAQPAEAFIFLTAAPSFPESTAVGQTFSATVGLANLSTPPDVSPVSFREINLIPACSTSAVPTDCAGVVEPGVFQVSATGAGSGPQSCTGTWTASQISPGTYRLVPPGGEGSVLLAAGETCIINLAVTATAGPRWHGAPTATSPVPADYDGNGTTDIAVYRPSSGLWLVHGGPTIAFGTSGDQPLPFPSAIRMSFFAAQAT